MHSRGLTNQQPALALEPAEHRMDSRPESTLAAPPQPQRKATAG